MLALAQFRQSKNRQSYQCEVDVASSTHYDRLFHQNGILNDGDDVFHLQEDSIAVSTAMPLLSDAYVLLDV